MRRNLRWSVPAIADLFSDGVAALTPVACLASLTSSEGRGVFWADVGTVMESVAGVGLVNQVSKRLAMRERPFARGRPSRWVLPDRYGSFFSGHTSSTAAACAASVLANLRSRHSTRGWMALCLLPVLVGYLRIAADRHYFTDVIAGLGIGAGFGSLYVLVAMGSDHRAERRSPQKSGADAARTPPKRAQALNSP
jgi:membrane-associated phospholipid phosphatase